MREGRGSQKAPFLAWGGAVFVFRFVSLQESFLAHPPFRMTRKFSASPFAWIQRSSTGLLGAKQAKKRRQDPADSTSRFLHPGFALPKSISLFGVCVGDS